MVESSAISPKWVTSTFEKCPERHSILGGRRKLGFGYFHCFCALSRLYNLSHLQFLLLILCWAIMHYLCPSTGNLTDKALSLALQECTVMIKTRKIQSNLNVFPTERALLEELLHILHEKRRENRFNHHILQKSPTDKTRSDAIAPKLSPNGSFEKWMFSHNADTAYLKWKQKEK